jgi:hypothetical protein
MKTFIPTCIALATISLAALPNRAHADEKDWEKGRRIAEQLLESSSDRDRDRDRDRYRDRDGDRDRDYDRGDRGRRDRDIYLSRPSSTFVLTFGNGYAGRGYYYGPANASYYYERSGVRYFRDRDSVPSQYWRGQSSSDSYSRTEAAVQRALSQRGYYRGPIDGDMGPGSRAAVARYQADNGLKATGAINDSLLKSLGL